MLVIEHRLLARHFAKGILRKWRAYCDSEELHSVVDIALCEAAARFDPKQGAKFTTWLYYFLRGYLIREVVMDACGSPRTGAGQVIDAEHVWGNGREHDSHPDHHELSFKRPVHSSYYGLRPDEMLYRKQLMGLSGRAVERLHGIEKKVVQSIYTDGRSISATARKLGYSRGHISRVHNRALRKLKNYVTMEKYASVSPVHGNTKFPTCIDNNAQRSSI